MKTIIVYNAKGGVGSTLFSAAFCIVLARAGVRVVGASLDSTRHLERFLAQHGIPWFDATAELPQGEDVLVLDVRSHTDIVDVLRPTLWVMLMDNSTAYENAINVMPRLAGPAVWVWNSIDEPEVTEGRPVPESLRERVTFAEQFVLRDSAIYRAAERFELACSDCSEAMRQIEALVYSTATRAGVQLSDAPFPAWRGTEHTIEQCRAYLASQREREQNAREHLRAFFTDEGKDALPRTGA